MVIGSVALEGEGHRGTVRWDGSCRTGWLTLCHIGPVIPAWPGHPGVRETIVGITRAIVVGS